MTKTLKLMTLAATLALAVTTTRASTVTLDWSETGSSFGNGSGTLTIDATSDVGSGSSAGWDYTLHDFTGSIGSYTGLALYGGNSITLSSATVAGSSLLGMLVILTDDNGDGLEIYGGTSSFPPATASSPYVFADFGVGVDAGHDTFTLAIPVPEPAPLPLATLGGLGLVAFRRRK